MAQKDQSRVTDPNDFGAAVDAVAGVTPPAQASAPASPAEDPSSDFGAAVDAVAEQAVAPPPPPTYKGEPPGYQPPTGFLPATSMVAGKALSKIPIVGPPIKAGLDYLAGGPAGSPRRNEMAAAQQHEEELHPNLAAGGEILGTGLGLSLAAAAAPEMMGMSATDALATAATKAGLTSGGLYGLNSIVDSMVKGDDPSTWIPKAEKEAAVNAVGGVAGPVVGRSLSALFSNVISPRVAQLAQLAINRYGIPIGADMVSTNPLLRFARNLLPLGQMGQAGAREARERAFWTAVNGRTGEASNILDDTTLGNTAQRIGAQYDQARALATQPMRADVPLEQTWIGLRQQLNQPGHGIIWQPGEQNEVQALMSHVSGAFRQNGGALDGQLYKELTKTGSMLDSAMNSGSENVARAANQIDAGLKQWFIRNAPPRASELMQTSDQQWRNMKVLENLVRKHPGGDAKPEDLWDALMAETEKGTIQFNPSFGQGGDMAELARIGRDLMPRSPPTREGLKKALSWLIHVPGATSAVTAGVAGAAGAVSPEIAMGAGVLGAGVSPLLAAGGAIGSWAARSPMLANALTRASLGAPGAVMRGGPAIGKMGLPFAQGAASEGARALAASQLPEPAR